MVNKKDWEKEKKKLTIKQIDKLLLKNIDCSPIELEVIFADLCKKSTFSKTLIKKQFEVIRRQNKINEEKEAEKVEISKKEEVKTQHLQEQPSTPSTTFYMKSWGYYNKNKKIIVEQINPFSYVYNINGKIGIAKCDKVTKTYVNDLGDEKTINLGYGFIEEGYRFLLHKKMKEPYDARQFYAVPEEWEFERWIEKGMLTKNYVDLDKEVKGYLKEMFDFSEELDSESAGITIASSWIKVLLDSFAFLGIDATKGGGKTTLGENIYFLMRHGFVGGDISASAFPRLIEELDLNIFVDEIDQHKNDEGMMGIMRKGQRRNNPYVRCEGPNNTPVLFSVAGIHGFSYRSDVEDAFLDRSIRMHTTKSSDSQLAIINTHKRDILKRVSNDLWFWYIKHLFDVEGCRQGRQLFQGFSEQSIPKRKFIFSVITKHFTNAEKDYLKTVFGRDSELAYLCLNTAKTLKIDFLENLKAIIIKKKQDSETSENFYNETIRSYVLTNIEDILLERLKDGANANSAFYPKNKLYTKLIEYFKSLGVATIGTHKYNSILRDMGFVEGHTITKQRYQGNPPQNCLVFDEKICKGLGIKDSLRDKIKAAKDKKEEEKAKEEEPNAEETKDTVGDFK